MSDESPRAAILIVEDDRNQADAVNEVLQRAGHECVVVTAPRRAADILESRSFDLVITDLMMQDLDGMDILRAVKSINPTTEVIVITGHASIETAVEAIRQGAYDYIEKPLNIEVLRDRVSKALERRSLVARTKELSAQLDERFGFAGVVGNNPQMRRVVEIARQIAPTSTTVLVTGESGTGKELIARAIHNNSPRRHRNFVALNCAALSEGILESELFGHEKGAFTGAAATRRGRFEYADGGTLFLDEVGDMPMSTQIKLLRVLEDGEIMRVGSNDPIRVDVRLISATNRDLNEAITEKTFREDLYFRLKVVTLALPPLRERSEDIALLADYFLKQFSQQHGKTITGISPTALQALQSYTWPGNVRELRNTIETMVALARTETLDVEQLPSEIPGAVQQAPSAASLGAMTLQEAERQLIANALRATDGNRQEAARRLGIGERTLYRKIKDYGLF
ncbi:MAG: sigma-54-dependent Fis family transcriptional regulator [Planctomycetes bacterium]|nr:sigma-54-dependent Fis family transcriptional regulator [Planctomycetota bacterium]